MPIIQKIILIIFVIFLAGCKEELTYTYLLDHPRVLKQELDKCQRIDSNADKQCDVVYSAATKISAVIRDQETDPEKFGQTVLDAEFACVKAKQNFIDAQQALLALNHQAADAASVESAKNKLELAKQTYQAQHEEVKMLLAVLGLGSPE